MSSPPKYFERVRTKAVQLWEKLEHDPEVAGPWHQLFAQVQYPQHVVSELLQNADDAGATKASVEINDGEFVFTHDGKDFTEDQLASLCRFGYSNKRTMRTIGFRGIGFKSTFSLGDEVRLITPTLSVMFRRKRFSEPVWIDHRSANSAGTEIRVRFKDKPRQAKLQENLNNWMTTPASLLFFKTIRRLRIGDQEVHWKSHGSGPVEGSEWMATSKSPREKYLVLRSPAEELPADAQDEIRHERMVGVDGNLDLPPCQVELVLGPDSGPDMEGRLFVVLPTQVTTALPFACNAPFIQDPVRLQIKDPATSPTNRWLLNRVGEFAGSAMLAWLKCSKIEIAERCKAYSLFPDIDPEDEYGDEDDQTPDSLQVSCEKAIQEAFDGAINEKAFLMTEQGKLRPQDGCVAIPAELVEVWSESAISELLGDDEKPILNRHIAEANVTKLAHRESLTRLDKDDVIRTLDAPNDRSRSQPTAPKPKTWDKLLQLWSFVADEVDKETSWTKGIRIFPTKGSAELHQAADVTRVAEKKLLHSADDWEFLSTYARVLDQNWLRFLAEQRRKAESKGEKQLLKQVKSAYAILKALDLHETSEVGRLIENASKQFTIKDAIAPAECVRLAHIVAALGAPVPQDFVFLTGDEKRTEANYGILATLTSDIADLANADWWNEHVLHKDYTRKVTSCSESEWMKWVSSESSRLLKFFPIDLLDEDASKIRGRTQVEARLQERGAMNPPVYPYTTSNNFECTDWDFEDSLWEHWQTIASTDETVWGRIGSQILVQPQRYWSEKLNCEIRQISGGARRPITSDKEKLDSRWICKFRKLRCLEDTKGKFHLPSSLMRRTAQNESLLSVEAFVRKDFDTEENRPLLDALGVRTKAAGVEGLLDRLRSCAAGQNPSIDELFPLYQGLDQIVASHSIKDRQHVHDVFVKEALILTAENKWEFLSAVYLGSNEVEVPGAAVVHSTVRHLTMWTKIGVTPHPTVELVLEGLKRLASGQRLSANDLRSAQSFLPQHPERIWSECGHWLNLEGEWTTVKSLKYALVDESCRWDNLFSQVKQQIADFRMLRPDSLLNRPFSEVPKLAACLDDRPARLPKRPRTSEKKSWLAALGTGFQRVQLANQEDADRIHSLGKRLAVTAWQVVPEIEVIPYINNQRVGDARKADTVWKDTVLYLADRPPAKMVKAISIELGRGFGVEISDAIKMCYDRLPEFVADYLEENFSLAPLSKVEPLAPDTDKHDDSDDDEALGAASSGPESTADAIQSLLGTDASVPTSLPGELDRPDGPTSSRPGATGNGSAVRGTPTAGRRLNGKSAPGAQGGSGAAARDWFRVKVSPVSEGGERDSEKAETKRRDDDRAREAVVQFENANGRTAKLADEQQAGYDVISVDEGRHIVRRIEIKGVTDQWTDTATVQASGRQFDDGRYLNELGVEYWLYVVDRLGSTRPRIRAFRHAMRNAEHFYFQAQDWLNAVDEQGEVHMLHPDKTDIDIPE